MIPYVHRFHGHNSLRYVYTHGASVRSRVVTIKWIENTRRKKTRIAVVVSKKVVKSAVSRNRIRRRLYEYARLHLNSLGTVYDIVYIASSADLLTMSHPELVDQLDQLFGQANLYKTP